MAYVIAEPCVNVKDTACVDACPVDSIHSVEEANQYYIEPATCIDCGACEPVCPVKAIFPGDQVPEKWKNFTAINVDFFKGFDKAKSTSYTRKKKAEGEKGELTPDATGDGAPPLFETPWTEVAGWESLWEARRNDSMDPTEIRRRYGLVRSVIEDDDTYVIRFFLPEKTPNHPFLYRYSLPDELCTYHLTAETRGSTVFVRGTLADRGFAKLCGYANSFPDSFYVEHPFPLPIASVTVQPRATHVVDVVVRKATESVRAA